MMLKMNLKTLVCLAAVCGSSSIGAIAQSTIDFANHPFKAPGPNDLRGPCPGLNTLANHGFIPSDGRNLTIQSAMQAGLDVFNIQNDLLFFASKLALDSSAEIDTFTLKDIRLHNSFEHDTSVSRQDFNNGDNFSFNETVFSTLAASNPGSDFYNGTSVGLVLKERLEINRKANPQLINTIKEFSFRLGTSALYLTAFGNNTGPTAMATKEFVNIFFREERLPIQEGWKRSAVPINGNLTAPVRAEMMAAANWTADPGVSPTFTFVTNGNGDTATL